MATFDIIIPAYNAAKYLPFALESVESQTFSDWRILLVDDGSTDDTQAVVAPYVARLGPRMNYMRRANQGVSSARNAAIQAATAEYLALLDADDVWLPHRLADSLKALQDRPQAGLAYGLVTGIDLEGKVLDTFRGNPKHAEGHIAPYIYMRKVDLPSPTITVRRSCIDEVGAFDETLRVTEDRDLWLRIAQRYEVAFVPKVLSYYRMSPGSLTTDPKRMLESQLQFARKNYGSAGCGMRERQVAMARAYKQQAEALQVQRRPWEALISSLRALALYPFDMDNPRTAASLLLNWIRSLSRA